MQLPFVLLSPLIFIKEKKQEEANNRRKNAIASDQKGAECSQGRIEADELAKVLTQRHLQLVDIAPDGVNTFDTYLAL